MQNEDYKKVKMDAPVTDANTASTPVPEVKEEVIIPVDPFKALDDLVNTPQTELDVASTPAPTVSLNNSDILTSDEEQVTPFAASSTPVFEAAPANFTDNNSTPAESLNTIVAPTNNDNLFAAPNTTENVAADLTNSINTNITPVENSNTIPDQNLNTAIEEQIPQVETLDISSLTSKTNPAPLNETQPVKENTVVNDDPVLSPPATVLPTPELTSIAPVAGISPTDPKAKKKKNIFPLILLILFIIACAGAGYWYLKIYLPSKPSADSFSLKAVQVEVNSELPSDITYYVNANNLDKTKFYMDLSNVDNTKIGDYKFTVSYESFDKEGTVSIVDTKAPIVTVKEVTVAPGVEVNANSFIDTCDDSSSCSATFKDSSFLNTISAEGTYTTTIVVSDESGNTTEAEVSLKVDKNVPITLVCEGKEFTDSEKVEYVVKTLTINFDNNKKYKSDSLYSGFKYKTQDIYDGIKESSADKDYTYDDANLIIYMTTENTVTNNTKTTYSELKEYYESLKMTCK